MSDAPHYPPAGMCGETIESLLAHERELWDAGIDAPEWHPRHQNDEVG